MANSSNYRVKLRRRREGKTDYQARKALVSSGRPRLVTRTALKNITVQILMAKPHGDEVLAATNSRELVKAYGWRVPTGNIPTAYLTGYLCGLKAKANGVKEAILDIGLVPPIKGAKVFAALSGVVDAGVDVPHSEEKIVKERMKGEHIAKYAKSLGAGSEEYSKKFSQYTAQGIAPEKVVEHFSKIKTEITDSFKTGKQVIPEIKAPAKEEVAPVKKAKEAKAPVQEQKIIPVEEKKPAAKKEKAKVPAKKAAVKPKAATKKAAKEEAPVEPKRASKAKAPKATEAAPKATKSKPAKEKAPKEKASKKGEKKA
jgi:large subunit ribosomal protein L18